MFICRSGTAINPAADVWQYMQLKKQVDANEAGVTKVKKRLLLF